MCLIRTPLLKHFFLYCLLSCLSFLFFQGCTSSPSLDEGALGESGKEDVYGHDSRVEITDPRVPPLFKELGRSVGMILPQYRIARQTEESIQLEYSSLNDRIWSTYGGPLCLDEPFIEQPAPGSCTAFLIASNRVATAGHCVNR